MSLADLYRDPPAPPVSLWGAGWIVHPSLVVIGAEQKVGKSLLAMDLLGAVVNPARTEWLGAPLATVSRSLYLNEEVPQSSVFQRANLMWVDEHERGWHESFLIPPERGLRFDTDPLAFYEIVEQTRADVICVDPLGRYHTWDENSNQQMGMLLDRLSAVVKHLWRTVVIVVHFRKPSANSLGGESPFQRFRGASRIPGDADTLLTLERAAGGYVLDAQLRHGEWPGPIALRRDGNLRYSVRAVGDTGVDRPAAQMEAALRLAGSGIGVSTLRTRLESAGIPNPVGLIQQLIREGSLLVEGASVRARPLDS